MQFMRVGFLLLGGLMFLCGCFDSKMDVKVEQPLQFNHAKHIQYFLSGSHKTENIQWHLVELEEDEAPPELLEGNCLECHDALEDKPNCVVCHLIFQDENVKKNRTQRPCLGCHQGAWTGYRANIPTIKICKSCHSEKPRTVSDQEKILRRYIKRGEDIPWVQLTTFEDHVHFSHLAHIRFAGLACAKCHPQKTRKQFKPPGPVSNFSMDDCVDCHEQEKASNDCLTCHK